MTSDRRTRSESPLKDKPLRNPGQGLDEELRRLWDDEATPYIWIPMVFVAIAGFEWWAFLTDQPRQPILYTITAAVLVLWGGVRLFQLSKRSKQLKLGRDGERSVGQYLERLRDSGARILHDVPTGSGNLDHVVVAPEGLFVIETKTWSKPHPDAQIEFDGERILKAGQEPDRDPIKQVRAEVDWLRRMLEESTGRRFPVRGVVVFPGWWVQRTHREKKSDAWVLEPKALPSFIEHQPTVLTPEDVQLAAYHLGRYVKVREAEQA
jgi:hypothetical protein